MGALRQHGFALVAGLLFAAAVALGILAGQRWADHAASANRGSAAHPGLPVIASAQRPGLALQVRLPTDRYLGKAQ